MAPTIEVIKKQENGAALCKVYAHAGRGSAMTRTGSVEVILPTKGMTFAEFITCLGGEAKVRKLALAARLVEIRASIKASANGGKGTNGSDIG